MAGCDDVDGIMSELEADPDDHFDSFGIFLNSSSKSLRQSSKYINIFLACFQSLFFLSMGPERREDGCRAQSWLPQLSRQDPSVPNELHGCNLASEVIPDEVIKVLP